MPMHIARFQRFEFSPARGQKCGLYLMLIKRLSHNASAGNASTGTAARCATTVFRKSSAIAHAMLISATPCSPRHAGIRIHLQDLQLALRRADQVNACIIGIDGAHCGHRYSRHLGIGKMHTGFAALVDVGHPVCASARHRGYDAMPGREHAPVFKDAVLRSDIVLHVIHVVDGLRNRKLVLRRDHADAFALASEQRLHHQRAIESFGILKCMRQRFADARSRRRDAGLVQQERRLRFVDAPLDGARIVPHAYAALAQGVQQAEAKGNLLERSGRDRAHENAVRKRAVEARNIDPACEGRIEGAMRQRRDRDARPHFLKRSDDAAGVPFAAAFFDQKRKVQTNAKPRDGLRRCLNGSSHRRSPAPARQPGRNGPSRRSKR